MLKINLIYRIIKVLKGVQLRHITQPMLWHRGNTKRVID